MYLVMAIPIVSRAKNEAPSRALFVFWTFSSSFHKEIKKTSDIMMRHFDRMGVMSHLERAVNIRTLGCRKFLSILNFRNRKLVYSTRLLCESPLRLEESWS